MAASGDAPFPKTDRFTLAVLAHFDVRLNAVAVNLDPRPTPTRGLQHSMLLERRFELAERRFILACIALVVAHLSSEVT